MIDLESLREIFKDQRIWIDEGIVRKVHTALDMSFVKAEVEMLHGNGTLICSMTYLGAQVIPSVKDVVIVAFSGDDDRGYIIGVLPTGDNKVHERAKDGTVLAARSGKALSLVGDRIYIGSGSLVKESEPLVLGNELVDKLSQIMDIMLEVFEEMAQNPIGMGNLSAPVPAYPAFITFLELKKTELDQIKSQVSSLLSEKAFTEK